MGVPASAWKLHQGYREGFQLGCRQCCCCELSPGCPPQRDQCRAQQEHPCSSPALCCLNLAADQLQKHNFQHPAAFQCLPSTQLLTLYPQFHLHCTSRETEARRGGNCWLPPSSAPPAASPGHPGWKSGELCLEMLQRQMGMSPQCPGRSRRLGPERGPWGDPKCSVSCSWPTWQQGRGKSRQRAGREGLFWEMQKRGVLSHGQTDSARSSTKDIEKGRGRVGYFFPQKKKPTPKHI